MAGFQNVNPQDFLSIVTDVRLLKWGSEVQIECLDDPVTRQLYVLVFKNCTEVRLHIHELSDADDPEDDLIGVLPGKEKYQEPAVITGRIFELWVLYESFEIQRCDKKQPILSYLDE